MTQAELILALAALPDEGEVLIEPWPEHSQSAPPRSELFRIDVEIIDAEDWHSPAFAPITPVADATADFARGSQIRS